MNKKIKKQCNYKKAIIGFLKFMNMDNPLMEIMIDEFLEEVYDGVSMSEERFECVFVEDKFGGTSRKLKDNETNITYMTCDVADLLNFQNTQIKILEEQNKTLIKQNDIIMKFLRHRGLTDEEWQFMRRLEKELFDDE